MLSFIPGPILLVFNLVVLSVVTLILALPIFIGAVIRVILPLKPVLKALDALYQSIFFTWAHFLSLQMALTNKTKWDLKGFDQVKVNGSCMIICNHLSWTDIVMLIIIYRGRIPITKFFLKHSLIYIPIIGQVCYALGMPFLRRYTRSEILKNPKLKTKDLDATRKACLSVIEHPSTLVNFLEGTRFTKAKAQAQKSPYQNLMPPKTASLAVALGIIGPKLDCILNTTLQYPKNESGTAFIDLLSGRLHEVIARVEVIGPETIQNELTGDYMSDKQFKRSFTQKVRQLWQAKDEQIAQLLGIAYQHPEAEADPAQSAAASAETPAAPAEDIPAEAPAASAETPAAEAKPEAQAQAPAAAQPAPEPVAAGPKSNAESK
ncbi:MAG TPA: 1-acyl-sn-glycerol-3-phosphate acyltransferase [Candidatus Anaerobiospirillum stercoravium]|nr:1-acyl-sn-glycerol-3-phosphate acyltransferase [Candidatus Anaerobiospirillum stercoravium]